MSSSPPIIILGCPRSGTLLISRILGQPASHFLITEHGNKAKYCPEDNSGIDDARMWWDHFTWPVWDVVKSRPYCEIPHYDEASLLSLRDKYLQMAGGRRLVIKNPTHIARIGLLRRMFPDAQYVFVMRSPWTTIQSMTVKGNHSFLMYSDRVCAMPEDLLLRAVVTWTHSYELFRQYADASWTMVKYEDLVSHPAVVVETLYERLAINDSVALEKAVQLPGGRDKGYSPIKALYAASSYQTEIQSLIRPACEAFGYQSLPDTLPDGDVGVKKPKKRNKGNASETAAPESRPVEMPADLAQAKEGEEARQKGFMARLLSGAGRLIGGRG